MMLVNSNNEWDELESIVVGTAVGATVPPLHHTTKSCSYPENWEFFNSKAGQLFPEWLLKGAQIELDNLSAFLQSEGIKVFRPEAVDFQQEIRTPFFSSTGLYGAMPRDVLTVLGDTIVQAPMAWPSRFFEHYAYHEIMLHCINDGNKWVCAPKPRMDCAMYRDNYAIETINDRHRLAGLGEYITLDTDICFDAADLVRFGTDIFIQRSQVTNANGIKWIKNQFGDRYRITELSFEDPNPMHIDATFMPLRPGLILANPERPCRQLRHFTDKGWEVIYAEKSTLPDDWPLYLSSKWLSMNILLLNTNTAIVEENEIPTHKLLERHGFKLFKLPFRHVYSLGGSFHCATLDISRRGSLEDYNIFS